MRLLHNLFENRDQFSIQSRDLGLDFLPDSIWPVTASC